MTDSRNYKGFTLIEVMIVLAIIAILAAIAFPSYQESVRKSRRSDAQALLLNFAQAQERHFTQNLQYATTIKGTASNTNLGWSSTNSSEGYYELDLINSNFTATTFSAVVKPVAGGVQAGDAKCTAISITNTGVKGKSGTGTLEDCW
ncbi:MAG: prepilin-type N-terminal cleavage/methylation domain-containing protein [Pseudomonadales bacterium]|nr:prepilin-type N-terminal cleavage/methylation domain-containing protein [Pseudomonadales bacterium]MCP5213874.1 prepilin-type N-terminal cleavage/methylation domain-containing protein [Pseudomonadales bacterium]